MATAKETKDDISPVSVDASKGEVFYSVILRLPKFCKLREVDDFVTALKPFVEVEEILGLGQIGVSGQWQLTLKTAEARAKLLQRRVISVNGKKCTIYPYEKRQVIGRIHWLPIEVTDDAIKGILKNFGSVVHFCKENIDADHDTPKSLVRFFILNLAEDAVVEEIPHFIMVEDHQGLVIIRDRDPMCLHCSQIGHRKSECPSKPSHFQKQLKLKKKHVLKKETNKTRASISSATDKVRVGNFVCSEESLKRRGYVKIEPPNANVLCSSTSTSENKKNDTSKSNQTIDSPCSSSSNVKQTEQIAQKSLTRALAAKEGVSEMVDEVKNLQGLMNVFSQKINQVLTDIGSTLHDNGNKADTRPVDLEAASSSSVTNTNSSNKSGKKKKKRKGKSNNYDLAAAEAASNETSSSGQYSPKGSQDSGIAISSHSSSVNTSVNGNEIQSLLSKVESTNEHCPEADNINTNHSTSSNQKKKKRSKKKSGSSIPGLTHP